jgi:glutaredoxin
VPERPAVPPVTGELQVLKDARFLFTYVEPNGSFATTDKPEIIPEVARKLVRVIDPGNTRNAEADEVYVASVKELLQAGKTVAKPLPRDVFETAAIAQLPPGASSMRGAHPPSGQAHALAPGDAGIRSVAGTPVVTIYGTSWCGACRAARQYFSDKKIPFADKDIEADPDAASELAEKASRAGVPTDRVPVLDVRGRLLLGFDPARVEALLGNPT